jgi:hypothetical protein
VFGEYERPVDLDVEDTAGTGDDLQLIDVVFVLLQNLCRQTDGLVRIRSLGAVRDVDPHEFAPLTWY